MSEVIEQRAKAFAEERHADQRYGSEPYVTHLAAVRAVLSSFAITGPVCVAAWLHDVLEDTPTSREELETEFGPEVTALVWAVTGVGKNRKERNASAYEKIRALPAAATLKLADRIANVEASRSAPDKLKMYRSEAANFEAALGALGEPRMWSHLRTLLAEG
ncbi:HD domain-containing protein [Anatilimnocola floriformis]|uniref:HD domain-containing protein n=1 Tax=Anatilimnocola floriformis TaxID=2948575 RepID=UPI0020C25E22|nr:HD domain-containing protein [Anatilimnocola floriformis]